MTTVHAPRDRAGTFGLYVGAGVLDFVDGVAVADFPIHPKVRDNLEAAGYTIDADDTQDDDTTEDATDFGADLEAATVQELRDYAQDRGIDLTGATRKADIVAAINGNN